MVSRSVKIVKKRIQFDAIEQNNTKRIWYFHVIKLTTIIMIISSWEHFMYILLAVMGVHLPASQFYYFQNVNKTLFVEGVKNSMFEKEACDFEHDCRLSSHLHMHS